MSTPYCVPSTHDGYDEIHAAWISNGSPAQFDIFYAEDIAGFGEGGAVIKVLDRTAENPDFYIVWSFQPTVFDADSAAREPEHRGILLMSADYWKMRGYAPEDGTDEADWHIIQGEEPPSELVEGT